MISLKKTLTKLCELGVGSNIPGKVIAYAGTNIPRGWMLCDGRAISRTQYSALFSAIETTYGEGDGSTTFNVPDLRGRTTFGYDSRDTDTEETFGVVGSTGGKRGAWWHSHIYGFPNTLRRASYTGAKESYGDLRASWDIQETYGSGDSNNTLNAAKANMPPYMILNYIICIGENFEGALQSPIQTADWVTSVGSDGTRTWNSGNVDSYKNEYVDISSLITKGQTWGYGDGIWFNYNTQHLMFNTYLACANQGTFITFKNTFPYSFKSTQTHIGIMRLDNSSTGSQVIVNSDLKSARGSFGLNQAFSGSLTVNCILNKD